MAAAERRSEDVPVFRGERIDAASSIDAVSKSITNLS
jgi:hypothetical protein